MTATVHAMPTKPKPAKRTGWLKKPTQPRTGEQIGGGYFVFRRGDGTGRIRPGVWPFEHPTIESARAEAKRLAEAQPGYRFDVVCVCGSVQHPPPPPTPPRLLREA